MKSNISISRKKFFDQIQFFGISKMAKIWFHKFFCLDFFNFSGPRCVANCLYRFSRNTIGCKKWPHFSTHVAEEYLNYETLRICRFCINLIWGNTYQNNYLSNFRWIRIAFTKSKYTWKEGFILNFLWMTLTNVFLNNLN